MSNSNPSAKPASPTASRSRRDSRRSRAPSRGAEVDGVERQQRVAREIHLGHQAAGEILPEQGEVNVVRAPAVGVVLPRVGPRLDGQEAVAAVLVGQAAPGAEEVRVERRVVLVGLVHVAPGRVGLPDLDQGVRRGPAVLVQHPPGDDDALAQGGAVAGRVAGQVVIEPADVVVAVDRGVALRQGALQRHQRPGRAALGGRFVARVEVRRLAGPVPGRDGRLGRHGFVPLRSGYPDSTQGLPM